MKLANESECMQGLKKEIGTSQGAAGEHIIHQFFEDLIMGTFGCACKCAQ